MSSLRKGSAASSRATFPLEEEPHYEEMTDEELKQALELATRTNKVLAIENDVFERYLNRHEPQCLLTMGQVLEATRHAQKVASQAQPTSSTVSVASSIAAQGSIRERQMYSPSSSGSQTLSGSRRHTGVQAPTVKAYRITLTHRIEMANKEVEEMKKDLTYLEQVTVKRRANLKAHMEEVEIRIRETYEAREELEETVVKQGADPITGRIPGEKFIRFMEEWLKAADSIIEKLRLKSSTIKAQIKKAKHQLRQREELGETLHAIDFQQLAIENQDYVKKIEEKNMHLLELKRVTGRYNAALTNYKRKLANQQITLSTIKKDIGTKKTQIDKLRTDSATTQHEVEKAEKELARIMQLMEEYTAPEVLDFVKLKAELREMQKTYRRLERHRQIQMTALGSFKKQQVQLEETETNAESGFS